MEQSRANTYTNHYELTRRLSSASCCMIAHVTFPSFIVDGPLWMTANNVTVMWLSCDCHVTVIWQNFRTTFEVLVGSKLQNGLWTVWIQSSTWSFVQTLKLCKQQWNELINDGMAAKVFIRQWCDLLAWPLCMCPGIPEKNLHVHMHTHTHWLFCVSIPSPPLPLLPPTH